MHATPSSIFIFVCTWGEYGNKAMIKHESWALKTYKWLAISFLKSHMTTNYIHFSITIVVITCTACAYYILNTIHITLYTGLTWCRWWTRGGWRCWSGCVHCSDCGRDSKQATMMIEQPCLILVNELLYIMQWLPWLHNDINWQLKSRSTAITVKMSFETDIRVA